MTPRDYLLDRLPLVLGFAVAIGFLLLVVHLGVAPLTWGNAAYVLLLGAVTGAVLMFVDYRRQAAFRRAVARRLAASDEAEYDAAPLPPAKSREQAAFAALLAADQRRALGALQRYRQSAEQHRTFVDLWVHQMKTPLAVLELTAEQQDDSEEWRSVTEEVGHLSEGLELMLTSARLERFELDLKPVQVDLTELARSGVNALKASWLRHGVYPSVSAPEGGVTVESDPKWLAVVLRQLLTNALKYSPSGARVRVEVSRLTSGGARLSVVDEGMGIPPEDVPRVFDRFFTGHNGRRTQASTGMGLFLAAEICRRLGHELTVESAVGEGSTFTVAMRPQGLHRRVSGQNVTPL
ncbi:MAG: sensor histidine kinase [Trueperaceae bacterium]